MTLEFSPLWLGASLLTMAYTILNPLRKWPKVKKGFETVIQWLFIAACWTLLYVVVPLIALSIVWILISYGTDFLLMIAKTFIR